jgi:hypothetical protein
MATTTPNYGWVVPTSTDLVKNGATAIETLGDSIDASFVGLKGGTTGQVLSKTSGTDLAFTWVAQDDSNAIQNAIVTAKGDLIGATANATPARLAVGTAGQVLTVDSAASTGLTWTTPASGGSLTLLSTTTLSGATTSIAISPSAYKDIEVRIKLATSSGGAFMQVGFNGTTGVSTQCIVVNSTSNTVNTGTDTAAYGLYAETSSNNLFQRIHVYEVNSTTMAKNTEYSFVRLGGSPATGMGVGMWQNAAAISQIDFRTSSGTFTGGTVEIYGVK